MGKTNFGSGRLPSLDGIRAVSIFMVLFAHASNTLNFPSYLVKRPSFFLDGKLGVRVFFVISGFLITSLLLKEKKETDGISLPAFYKRRALRILPVYYFYIFVIALVAVISRNPVPLSTFISATTFTTDLWGTWNQATSWLLAHTWSLSVEEQFYLTWPALLAFFGIRWPGKIWVPLLLLMAPLLRWMMWDKPAIIDHLFLFQGDSIASGCLLAILMDRRKAALLKLFQFHPTLLRLLVTGLIYNHIFFAIVLSRLGVPFPAKLSASLTPTLQCLSISFLIGSLVMNRSGISYAFLNHGGIQWVGRLSYSLYIWQQIALVPVASLVCLPDWAAAKWLVQFPQNLVIVFVLALASYYGLELPMLTLKAKFSKVEGTARKIPKLTP